MNAEYRNGLIAMLAREYGLLIREIHPSKRGFFGETWKVQTDKADYFLKIDYWEYHKEAYRDSLAACDFFTEKGIAFVPRLLKTKNGQLSCRFQDGIAAVFEYVEGENTEEYPVSRLFERLAVIYALDPDDLDLKMETLGTEVIDAFRRLSEAAQGSSVITAALREKAAIISQYAGRLRRFSDLCRAKKWDMRITHGDAGGNCILNGDDFTIIDWDSVKRAPIERDAWFFICDSAQMDAINAVLERSAFPVRLQDECIYYYCYYSFFYYMTEHLLAYLNARDEEQREKQAYGFKTYLESCWIFEQLKIADAYIID